MMKNTITKKMANKNGFSLIELMIALTIFAVGILALAQLQSSAIVYNSEARRYTDATIVAQSAIDGIRALNYSEIETSNINTKIDVIVPDIPSYLTVTSKVDPGPFGTKEIEIEVKWVHKGDKSYLLKTIIADK